MNYESRKSVDELFDKLDPKFEYHFRVIHDEYSHQRELDPLYVQINYDPRHYKYQFYKKLIDSYISMVKLGIVYQLKSSDVKHVRLLTHGNVDWNHIKMVESKGLVDYKLVDWDGFSDNVEADIEDFKQLIPDEIEQKQRLINQVILLRTMVKQLNFVLERYPLKCEQFENLHMIYVGLVLNMIDPSGKYHRMLKNVDGCQLNYTDGEFKENYIDLIERSINFGKPLSVDDIKKNNNVDINFFEQGEMEQEKCPPKDLLQSAASGHVIFSESCNDEQCDVKMFKVFQSGEKQQFEKEMELEDFLTLSDPEGNFHTRMTGNSMCENGIYSIVFENMVHKKDDTATMTKERFEILFNDYINMVYSALSYCNEHRMKIYQKDVNTSSFKMLVHGDIKKENIIYDKKRDVYRLVNWGSHGDFKIMKDKTEDKDCEDFVHLYRDYGFDDDEFVETMKRKFDSLFQFKNTYDINLMLASSTVPEVVVEQTSLTPPPEIVVEQKPVTLPLPTEESIHIVSVSNSPASSSSASSLSSEFDYDGIDMYSPSLDLMDFEHDGGEGIKVVFEEWAIDDTCYTFDEDQVMGMGMHGVVYSACKKDEMCDKVVKKMKNEAEAEKEIQISRILDKLDPEGNYHPKLYEATKCRGQNVYNLVFKKVGKLNLLQQLQSEEQKKKFTAQKYLDLLNEYKILLKKYYETRKSRHLIDCATIPRLYHHDIAPRNVVYNELTDSYMLIDWGSYVIKYKEEKKPKNNDDYHRNLLIHLSPFETGFVTLIANVQGPADKKDLKKKTKEMFAELERLRLDKQKQLTSGGCVKEILFTVPHAACPPGYEEKHTCDFVAKDAADILRSKNADISSLILGKVPRTKCDLNRKQCRNELFRKTIREMVEKYKYKTVVDVHSYPVGVEKGEWDECDVVLMNIELPDGKDYTMNLARRISKKGLSVGIVSGTFANDIVLEMRQDLNKRSLLIEFNEKRFTKQKAGKIADAIREWVKDETDLSLEDQHVKIMIKMS